MKFFERSSASNVTAGRAGAQAALDFHVANRENSNDYTTMAKAAMDGRSKERQAVTAANSQIARQGLRTATDVKLYEMEADLEKDVRDIKAPARRFAGIVGIGQALGGYAMWKKMRDKDQKALDDLNDKLDRNFQQRQQMAMQGTQLPQSALDLLRESGIQLDESGNPSVMPGHFDVEKPPGMKDVPAPAPAAPVQKMSYTPGSGQDYLTGDWLKAAQEVLSLEASGNYNAYNQGGRTEFEPINSGDYKADWGRDMTSMTINEVMEKQSGWNDRSITDAQWRASAPGKIHAAGGFQFIGPTLPGVVRRAGIDPNSKFDIPTQQKLFKFHALEVGGFHPWSATKGKGLEQKYAHLFRGG